MLPPVYPSPLRSLAFFKWDDSVDGVEPPPALNLHLQKYVINNYFDNSYYGNIDLVKQILKTYFTFSTKEQEDKTLLYKYIKYRDIYEL